MIDPARWEAMESESSTSRCLPRSWTSGSMRTRYNPAVHRFTRRVTREEQTAEMTSVHPEESASAIRGSQDSLGGEGSSSTQDAAAMTTRLLPTASLEPTAAKL